jgi:thiol-disulfide isomerase/thioredoxin/YHS domain-containing protein
MISNRKPWQWVVPALLTLVVATQVCSAKSNLGPAWKRSYQEAEAESRRLDRPLLLHFGATWCGPCKTMEAQVLSSAEVRRLLKDNIVAVKIDVDESPDLARRYGVGPIPADIIISPNGNILDPQSVGAMSRDQYVAKLMASVERYRSTQVAPPKDPAPPVVDPSDAGKANDQKLAVEKPLASKTPDGQKKLIVAMDGYCPVTLWRTRLWIKGTKKYGADYQGVRFYFQTLEDRNDFIADPSRYAPQLLGCDPVMLYETERAIAGSPKCAAYFDGELFLFADAEHRSRFRASPEQFTRTRHVNLDEVEHADTRLGMKN